MPIDVSEYIFGLQRTLPHMGCEKKHMIGYFFDKSTAEQCAARISSELGVCIHVMRIKMETLSIEESISQSVNDFDEEGIGRGHY